MEGLVKGFHFSFLPALFAIAVLSPAMGHVAAQKVGLVALDVNEVARGYSAEATKLRRVVNDKGETVGSIHDFIFSKDGGSIFVVLAVGDFTGLLVAVPFQSLKLDDPSGYVVPREQAMQRWRNCRSFSTSTDPVACEHSQTASLRR
jgi:hypothetical protein